MVLNQASASWVIDESLNVLTLDEFVQLTPKMPALYFQKASNTPSEDMASISGLGDFQPKVDLQKPTADQVIQQFRKKFTHEVFALMTEIQREVVDDQQFNFVGQLGQKLGESAMRTMEKRAALPFNEAFSSTQYLTEDDKTLCADAHTNVDGGNSQDNKGTTAFSAAALSATRTLFRAFKDYRGNRISSVGDVVIAPPGLEDTVFEVIKSTADPGQANPAKINVNSGRYSAVIWDELTDANNWFLASSSGMRKNLLWLWRVPLETYGDGDLMAGKRSIGGYYRHSNGVVDWRWVYGHEVA